MATTPMNRSFASPLAHLEGLAQLDAVTRSFLSWVYDSLSGFNIFVILFLTAVLYDQCKLAFRRNFDVGSFDVSLNGFSQIYLEQERHCRTEIENSVHESLS